MTRTWRLGYACPASCCLGGNGDRWALERNRGGRGRPWPHAGLARRPRAGDRHSQDRVRAGQLAKDEFDLRVSQAFASRTYAELAAVTADLPTEPTAAQPSKSARARSEQPVLRPAQVIMAATALDPGVWAFTFLRPRPRNPGSDPARAVRSPDARPQPPGPRASSGRSRSPARRRH